MRLKSPAPRRIAADQVPQPGVKKRRRPQHNQGYPRLLIIDEDGDDEDSQRSDCELTCENGEKVFVMNEKSLVRKIQRQLPPHERLRKMRPGPRYAEYGPYYIEDRFSNNLIAWGIDDLNRLLEELTTAK